MPYQQPCTPPPSSSKPPLTLGPPPPRAGRNGRQPKILIDLDRFGELVIAGMELSELWSQFKRDAQSGYNFHQRASIARFYIEPLPGQPTGVRSVRPLGCLATSERIPLRDR
jgi:hypothetical protein